MVANKGTAILQAANSTLLISHCQASSKNQPCAALNSVLDELICWTPHTTSDGTFESDEERHDRERGIVRALAMEISAPPISVYVERTQRKRSEMTLKTCVCHLPHCVGLCLTSHCVGLHVCLHLLTLTHMRVSFYPTCVSSPHLFPPPCHTPVIPC